MKPTYYDILKVAPDAPPEIIKAAYRALCQKHHPDKFTDETQKAKATQIIALINQAYQVLSNPRSRADCDSHLAKQQDSQPKYDEQRIYRHEQAQKTSPAVVINVDADGLFGFFGKIIAGVLGMIIAIINNIKKAFHALINMIIIILRWLCIAVIISFIGTILFVVASHIFDLPTPFEQSSGNTSTSHNNHSTHDATSDDAKKLAEAAKNGADAMNTSKNNTKATNAITPTNKPKHLYAPNGKKFPSTAGYVQGYPKLHMDGLSTLTIENDQNDSAIFGKLIYLDGSEPKAVRHFYIPAWGGLILRDITAGNYDVRYKDLESGIISKTESFELREHETAYGSSYSEITMTLYKVSNGNMQTVTIPENQF